MKLSALKTLAAATIIAGALAGSAFATSIGGATVDASALNLRASASTDATILTSVPRGGVVVVGARVNEQWYKVVYKGAVGYMSAEFLTFDDYIEGNFGTGNIHGTNVRMRSRDSLSSTILGAYSNSEKMTVLGIYKDWYKVSYNGTTGYVYSDYFALNGGVSGITPNSAVSNTPVVTMGDTIVATAKKYIGTPYVWGGSSTSGFDCSGFVNYVYKENGYAINRTAASIYTNGVAVDRSALQSGDAICFSTNAGSGIGHVGIYIGDNQFIHSSSSSGCVTINSLTENYYNNHYVGARRIV